MRNSIVAISHRVPLSIECVKICNAHTAMDMMKITRYAVSRRLQWSDSAENPIRPAALNTASTARMTLMLPAMAVASCVAFSDAYFGRMDSASCRMSFSWEINARPQVMLR